MTESLLSKNTSNHFKFIMNPNRRKTCDLRRRNGTITLIIDKRALKVGTLLVTVRVLNIWSKYLLFTTSYKTPDCLQAR